MERENILYRVLNIDVVQFCSPENRRKSTIQISWRKFARQMENILRRSHTKTCRWPAVSIPRDQCSW
jgi:hypothetical protein